LFTRGFAVFADAWLSSWLAEMSADLRGNGSALEVMLHDYALYKSTFTLRLLYFLPSVGRMDVTVLKFVHHKTSQETNSI